MRLKCYKQIIGLLDLKDKMHHCNLVSIIVYYNDDDALMRYGSILWLYLHLCYQYLEVKNVIEFVKLIYDMIIKF